MAIALPLIIELFHSLDRAVQWLSGGSPESAVTGRDSQDGRHGRHEDGGPAQRQGQRSGTPLRPQASRGNWRALNIPH